MVSPWIKFLRIIYWKYPRIQPLFSGVFHFIYPSRLKFRGWGMETIHELPWNNNYDWKEFRKSCEDIKEKFDVSHLKLHVNSKTLDAHTYRHWVVAYCVRHAIRITNTKNANFVECGVGDGFSAFFALRQLFVDEQNEGIPCFHLYDAWESMDTSKLTKKESGRAGMFSELSLDRIKRHLSEFTDYLIFHQGHIPESLYTLPEPPDSIIYLHIDINSKKATTDALEFFYPKLVSGGVILFDDYGWATFYETKLVIDEFFSDKPGSILALPTGQAIYFK